MDEKRLVKVSEAALLVGVCRERIYAAVRQNWLKPVEGVPIVCFYEADVIAFRDREKPANHYQRHKQQGL